MATYELFPKVQLVDYVDELRFQFEDLPIDAAARYLQKAVHYLCRNAHVLKRTQILKLQCGVSNYVLESHDCMDIVAVHNCWTVDSKCLCNPTIARLPSKPDPHIPCCCGRAMWVELDKSIPEIHFVGMFDETVGIEMSVCPKVDSNEVDAIIMEKYLDVCLMGAAAYLYSLKGKPWTKTLAGRAAGLERQMMQDFKTAVADIAVSQLTGGQVGVVHIKRRIIP